MKKYATIIGTREISDLEFNILKEVANFLHNEGFILRSGGAEGSDQAIMGLENIQVFLPWNGFNGLSYWDKRHIVLKPKDFELAKEVVKIIHPAYEKLSQGALRLHCRNVSQIWGPELQDNPTPSSIVVFCASLDLVGKVQGGTATAVNIALRKGIPTYNIRNAGDLEKVMKDIKEILGLHNI
jgi:hypothetical protein